MAWCQNPETAPSRPARPFWLHGFQVCPLTCSRRLGQGLTRHLLMSLLSICSWALGEEKEPLTVWGGRWIRGAQRNGGGLSGAEKGSRRGPGCRSGLLPEEGTVAACPSSLLTRLAGPASGGCAPVSLNAASRRDGMAFGLFVKVRISGRGGAWPGSSRVGVQPRGGSAPRRPRCEWRAAPHSWAEADGVMKPQTSPSPGS